MRHLFVFKPWGVGRGREFGENRENREFSEFKEFRELKAFRDSSLISLISLNSLNSLSIIQLTSSSALAPLNAFPSCSPQGHLQTHYTQQQVDKSTTFVFGYCVCKCICTTLSKNKKMPPCDIFLLRLFVWVEDGIRMSLGERRHRLSAAVV